MSIADTLGCMARRVTAAATQLEHRTSNRACRRLSAALPDLGYHLMKVIIINHVTLDGVMQAPGRVDEGTRDGFAHDDWSQAYVDQVVGEILGSRMGVSGVLLLGRRTYDDLLTYWTSVDDSPFADALNDAPKWVLSNTMFGTPPWPNTHVIGEDALSVVRDLKNRDGGELHVMGSSAVVDLLLRHDLVDGLLVIHPIVLGTGRRLFLPISSPSVSSWSIRHQPLRVPWWCPIAVLAAERSTAGVPRSTGHRFERPDHSRGSVRLISSPPSERRGGLRGSTN